MAIYWSHLTAGIQLNCEWLQETAAAVKQLAHRALLELPADIMQREATHAFIEDVKD